jgi:hypothetical protein
MADRCVLAVDVYMPITGQSMVVLAGSTVDVNSSSMFRANQVSSVTPGGGTLLNGQHNQPGGPFKSK